MCSITDVLVITIMAVGVCVGQTLNDTQNILSHILTDYNPDIRPVYNQSLPVQINITMELVNIKEFDEVSERLTVVVIMQMTWTDTRLTWDPFEYNDTAIIAIPVRKIWKPNLVLTSPVEESRPVGGTQDWSVVKCMYDGTVFWTVGDTISSSCNIDVRYFPFDEQKCELSFIPLGFLPNEITLFENEDKVFVSFYTENGAWNLGDSIIESKDIDGVFSMYSVTFVLERRPTFFLVNAVLPVVFISFLNVLVFLIPVECGERVSYAITVFLALAVFMTIVGDNLPKNSKEMAVICYFLLINVAHSTVICFETIICLFTYHREGPVPSWLTYIFIRRSTGMKCKKTKIEKINAVYESHNENLSGEKKQIDDSCDKWVEDSFVQVAAYTVTWRNISRTLDKIFGIASTFLLLIFVLSFMISVRTVFK